MARPKSPPRVCGPYEERGGRRFRIRVCGHGTEKNLYVSTRAEALALKAAAERELVAVARRSIADVIDAYCEDKERQGSCKAETAASERERLRGFLAEHLDREVRELTSQQAAELYRDVSERPSKKTGKALEAASHRFYLSLAKRLFGWAEQLGYVDSNPFQSVRPRGRPSAGKPQLRIDEANRFVATALAMFDEKNDVLALGAVLALLLGLRASEVLRRRVRDIDSNGRVLWIDQGKTRHARRHLTVPLVLQPRLERLCAGRASDELLLGCARTGELRHHRALWSAVGRVCARAQVPRVCTHSLRGLWATLSIESGALSDAVAQSLGHGSFAMTAKHYAQPEAVSAAKTQRVLSVLELNEPPAPMPPPANVSELDAETLFQTLPRATLSRLLELSRRA